MIEFIRWNPHYENLHNKIYDRMHNRVYNRAYKRRCHIRKYL